MISKPLCITAIPLLMLGMSSVQAAEKIGDVEVSANVALTSDYVWRGFSQTYNKPAIQGGFDLGHDSGVYVGTWASNIRFIPEGQPSDGAQMEIDAYIGYATEFNNGVGVDVGYNYYFYPDAQNDLNYDFGEFYLKGSYRFLTLSYNYANDFFGNAGKAHYLNLGGEYGLPYDATLSGSIGHQTFKDNSDGDYTDWTIAVSKSFAGLDFSLAYMDTDVEKANDSDELAQARAVFSVSKTF